MKRICEAIGNASARTTPWTTSPGGVDEPFALFRASFTRAPQEQVSTLGDELAKEMARRVRVAKLDVDANAATAARFGVRSIPTLLVLKGG
jgi:hypothetical protein